MSEANELLSNIKKGVKVKFGLVAQGHIPTIEKMLDKHCSWDEINKEIGWAGGAAQENYTRYLRAQSAEKDKRIAELEALESAFAEYERETETVPVGHENRRNGAVTYNWRTRMAQEIRSKAARLREGEKG